MKDSNNIHFLSSEMYFGILENPWSFWLALLQILFAWNSNEKLLFILEKFDCNYGLFLNTIKFINPLMFDLR